MFSYELFTKPYAQIISDVQARLEKANNVLNKQLGYAPIESMRSRIKSEESARSKLERKGWSFEERQLKELTDIAGLRIVCKFLEDIPEVVGLIKSWSNPKLVTDSTSFKYEQIDIIEEQDYIKTPKDSGYRSHHLICKKDSLLFEVQVRTIAMDFWATTEHMLNYKFSGDIPQKARDKLKKIAEKGAALDESMDDIRKDVEVGTAKDRLLEQINKAIGILENTGLAFKAEKYKERLALFGDNLEELKSLAIQAKEDVPKQYWSE